MYHTLLLSKQPKLITAIFKHKLCDKIKQQKKGLHWALWLLFPNVSAQQSPGGLVKPQMAPWSLWLWRSEVHFQQVPQSWWKHWSGTIVWETLFYGVLSGHLRAFKTFNFLVNNEIISVHCRCLYPVWKLHLDLLEAYIRASLLPHCTPCLKQNHSHSGVTFSPFVEIGELSIA